MGKGDRKKPRPRTASGQYSRAKGVSGATLDTLERKTFEQDARQTAYQARARRRGLPSDGPVTKAQVQRHRLDLGETPLETWLRTGALTAEQVAAAEAYAIRRADFCAAYGLPMGLPTAASYGATRGGSAPLDEEAAMKAKAALRACERLLNDCGRRVKWAMDEAAIHNRRAPVHLVRAGCDALIGGA